MYNPSDMRFRFKPVEHADLPFLVEWLAMPHVSLWWRDPATMEDVVKDYGPCIDGTEPTDAYIAYIGDKSIGLIQSYRLVEYPEHESSINIPKSAGIDLFIGDVDYIGKGYGPQMIMQFIENILIGKYPGIDNVVTDPEITNVASIKAFEKAGFKKGKVLAGKYGPEQLMVFEI